MSVPTNLIPTPITGLPEYTGSSTLGYMPYVIDGQTFKVQFTNIAAVGAVPSTRVIASGTGLAGGGDLSADRVISIAAGGVGVNQLSLTGVTAGTYGSGSAVPVLTVDATGRVTSATTAALSVTGFVPTSRTITAGNGLTGGGSLASDITLSANFSTTTPLALGSATAGVAITLSRGDHVHPALDLSDTNQTQGALPLGRGGTGDALSPVAGAVVYSTGTKFALSALGLAGQVLVSNGTSAPSWLTVSGTGTVTSVNASGGTTGLSFTGGPITAAGTLTLGGTLAIANGGTGTGTAFAAGSVVFAGASGVYTQKNSNFFWDNTNDRLGIGTVTPSATLDVNGNMVLPNSGIINFKDAGGVNRNVLQFISGEVRLGGAGAGLSTQTFYTAAAERMRIPANGDVLVNTTTSLYGYANNPSIELNGVDGSTIGLKKGNVAGSYISHSTNLNIFNTTANGIVLGANNTERMRITSAGNVGIGTTAPVTRFHVSQSNSGDYASVVLLSNSANAAADRTGIYGSPASGTANPYRGGITFWPGSSGAVSIHTGNNATPGAGEAMRIDGTNGNVGIGTSTPNASALLDVQSTTKGFRLPNMTTTQKNAISSPAAGLMVFDTTLAKACVYSGSAWQTITSI